MKILYFTTWEDEAESCESVELVSLYIEVESHLGFRGPVCAGTNELWTLDYDTSNLFHSGHLCKV